MIFLIEYNRDSGRIVTMRSFKDSERKIAQEAMLDLELALNAKSLANEVVLLEASDEDTLRRTHRRYFEDLRDLAMSPTA